jgi:tRNA uridine 5-carboxymethylaminomethyl modification enzyme
MEYKFAEADKIVDFLKVTSVSPSEANPVLEQKQTSAIVQSDKMFKILSRPQIYLSDMMAFQKVQGYVVNHFLDKEILEQAEIQVKYAGYIDKERNNADKLIRLENLKIPAGFDYSIIKSMSIEARQKLKKIQPITISQASRISGVSPSDISVLLIYLNR